MGMSGPPVKQREKELLKPHFLNTHLLVLFEMAYFKRVLSIPRLWKW